MGSFFYPAIALTNRLRYAQKFGLLGLLVLLAIVTLQASLYRALDRVIEPSRQELAGVEVVLQLQRCIQLVQQHRGLSAAVLGGTAGLQDKRADKAHEVDAAMQRLTSSLPARVTASKGWREVNASWSTLRRDGLSWNVEQNIPAHDRLVMAMMSLAPDIADATALTLDPDLDTFYLTQALIDLPNFLEQLGQTRGYGAVILSRKSVDLAGKTHMAEILGRVQIAHEGVKSSINKVISYNPQLDSRLSSAAQAVETDMLGVTDLVRAEIMSARFGVDTAAYIERVTALIDKGYMIGDDILAPALRQRIESRIADATASLRMNVAVSIVFGLAFAYLIIGSFLALTQQIRRSLDRMRMLVDESAERAGLVESIAAGDLSRDPRDTDEALPAETAFAIDSRDEVGELWAALNEMHRVQHRMGRGFVKMTQTLREHREAERAQDWFKSGINAVDMQLRGDRTLDQLTQGVVAELTTRVQGAVGVIYLVGEGLLGQAQLQLAASYAYTPERPPRPQFAVGEGLAGEAARTKKSLILTDLPSGYLPVASALTEAPPAAVIVVPLVHDDKLKGVIEIGSLHGFEPQHVEWLEQAAEVIAISIDVVQARQRVNELLEQTQSQTEELRVQQEELQQTNEELEERAQLLEQQRETIQAKNREVEAGNLELERKAQELERISTYKSEFLANMSHELRTPLNSMLILSSLLQQNKEGHLTPKQVEFAATIHGAGKDLLNLINDILDLSKIEAGQLELHFEEVAVAEMADELSRLFKPQADERHVAFEVTVAEGAPQTLRADGQRLQQILKNLLSNALKFTSQGKVALLVEPADDPTRPGAPGLKFSVSDTGIGIAPDKHEQIFLAFQQADGSTSRKYGGTGLGLSISRQLAHRMGGDIALRSEPGQGSVFTLHLPLDTQRAAGLPRAAHERRPHVAAPAPAPAPTPAQASSLVTQIAVAPILVSEALPAAEIEDDRALVRPDRRAILIVEDDRAFAGILRDAVREHGFDAIVAVDGESAIELASRLVPDAIILDVMLPRIDGWGVMRSLKDNLRTRHIPVHFMTCLEDRQKAMSMGAIGFVSKPVSTGQLDQVFQSISAAIGKVEKKLLLVEDDDVEALSVRALLETKGLEIVHVRTAQEALAQLASQTYDCMVLDLGLKDMSGFDLLDQIKRDGSGPTLPIIVHSGRNLSPADEKRLMRYTESIIIKGAQSPERLLNEVSLFLHLVESALPPEKQKLIRLALDTEAMFEARKVLLVDDDMRNIFSLSSALAGKGMRIVEATNGVEALAMLDQEPDVDIVLMDIMMPEMDGFEAMRRIRRDGRFAKLPIIALTAKAMVGDQKACLDAGANDYIAKPVDLDKLFSLMRVWLYHAGAASS